MKNLKHLVWSALLLVVAVASSCKYDDDEIWDKVNSLDNRLQNVEGQLNTMNSDISSMSSVVNALNGYVYVTAVTEKDNGYVISFSDGKTATITNGKDGAAGSDGKDGKDAPLIGFDKDTDGEYYWTQTIDGKQSWLTDTEGNKIPMTGSSAITPRLKVSATGYWMISYDNGVTYAEVLDESGNPVKAVGKDGQNGFDGDDGADGDSWFKNVTYDELNGILTLVMKNGEVIELTVGAPTGIPNDSQAGVPPTVTDGEETFQMPTSISALTLDPENSKIGRFTLPGINANGEWLKLLGTGEADQNIWVEINGVQKGIKVVNGEEIVRRSRSASPVTKAKADVVFLVDNSGSMSEEANKVAAEIIQWSQKLAQTMDVKFGCVGIDHCYVNGALNITDVQTLSDYLNVYTGTRRTSHYGQSMATPPADWKELQTAAAKYTNAGGECGGIMLHYADENLSFREGAYRYYVYFTDEPNQPGGNSPWSVLTVKSDSKYYNWDASKGVIYTVYSGLDLYGDPHGWTNWLWEEDPCLFSDYTGGKVIETTGDFKISLDELPITGAITQSFIITFNVTPDLVVGGTYDITIIIRYKDGSIISKWTYTGIQFLAA